MKSIDVVVLAMMRLGGDYKALDMEDIAVESHKLSPKTFAWRKYPEQVNLELVAYALRNAKRKSSGELVGGGQVQGWRLTVAGQKAGQILSEDKDSNNTKTSASVPEFRGSEGKRIKLEFARILQSEAFAEWSTSSSTTERSLNSLLKINSYTSDELLEIKKTRLARCRGVTDEMDAFLEHVLRK